MSSRMLVKMLNSIVQQTIIKEYQMRNIVLGILIGVLICTIVLCHYPIPETTQTCGNCGADAWFFRMAGE